MNINKIMYVCKKYKTRQKMNTISIDPNLYKGAELYAKVHNISIKSLVEKALLNILGQENSSFELKKEADLSPEVKSLIGIIKPSSQEEDINGRDARMEHLNEKYAL